MDLDRPRVGRAIHSRHDEPDELSAQLRFQMAAADTVYTLGHRTDVRQNEALDLLPIQVGVTTALAVDAKHCQLTKPS